MNVAKYIVLTKDKKEVRFFAAGIVNEYGTFTGIIHDYTGGGNYEEKLVFEDKWIPEVDSNNEPLEWDTQVEIFNTLSSLTVDKIEDSLDRFICYDTEVFNYVPQNGMMRYFDPDGVLVDNMSLRTPYGLGNTSFVDGYKIVDSIEYNISMEVA
ncbi:hypothetical protein [Sulfurimonas indica]|uniref:hypothetical protein n=1 Tax=Sulfurimonas TaxID=202746 RepID=UPI0012653CC3|nr:hypothetical protein [Sulfurimonas indica]